MLHKRIKQVREFYGKTQEQFSTLLGIEYRTYSRMEFGSKAIDYFVIMQLESVFGVSEAWLKGSNVVKMIKAEFIYKGETCKQIMTIGEHIRKIRCDNRMKQEEFAEAIGLSPSAGTTVSSWELHKVRISDATIEKIEKRFNVTLSRLGNPEGIITIEKKTHTRKSKLDELVKRARGQISNLNAILSEIERSA